MEFAIVDQIRLAHNRLGVLCKGYQPRPKMVTNFFGKRNFMQPMGRPKHALKVLWITKGQLSQLFPFVHFFNGLLVLLFIIFMVFQSLCSFLLWPFDSFVFTHHSSLRVLSINFLYGHMFGRFACKAFFCAYSFSCFALFFEGFPFMFLPFAFLPFHGQQHPYPQPYPCHHLHL